MKELIKLTERVYYLPGDSKTDRPFLYYIKGILDAMKERALTGEDIAFCNACILKEYNDLDEIKVIPADISITETTVLELGTITLQLIPRDSTHSRDSLFIFCPEEKMLFVGDADFEDHYEGNGTFDKDKLNSLLEFIESINFDTYLLGHDIPTNRDEALGYLNECYKSIYAS